MSIIHTGVFDEADLLGDIHFHPSGDNRPSLTVDWPGFEAFLSRLRARGLPTSNRFIYIIVADPSVPGGYATYAYGENDDPNIAGREVNPEATPCP